MAVITPTSFLALLTSPADSSTTADRISKQELPNGTCCDGLTKRPSYRHENEFRLLTRRAEGDGESSGLSIPIDPAVLIDQVVRSPRMEEWQADLFRRLMVTLEFRRPVHESSLLTAPW